MKQYVHPNKRFIASGHHEPSFGDVYYAVNTKFGDEVSVSSLICNESDLPSLGFIEKEEEPDTDTKWIDDVHSEYLEAIVSNSLYVGDDRFTDDDRLAVLKKAILSHMPKGKCK